MAQLQEHLLTEALTHANSITQLRIRNHLPPPLSVSSILFFHPKKKNKNNNSLLQTSCTHNGCMEATFFQTKTLAAIPR